MIKRSILCLALVGTPFAAAAQSVQDQIVQQLRDQGFREITLNRTWLGRVRVISVRDDLRRELVFNPQTGEILRDYWVTVDDDGPRLLNPSGNDNDNDNDNDGGSGGSGQSSGGSGAGGGSNDDDDDDDDGDDGDDDDDDDDDD